MSRQDAYYSCPFAKVVYPLCVTLLTESAEQKVRHPAVVLALCETGGEFTSPQRVSSGEAVSFILHPDLRYAIRGQVTWAQCAQDNSHFEFGVAFEDNIPDSLWESFAEQLVAA